MKLIDKDALVAVLEERKIKARENAEIASANNNVPVAALWSGKENICNELLSFLDTLEMKEVNLENEIDEVIHNYKLNGHRHTSICSADIEWIAKHFFELGLKAQKGE